MFGYVETCCGYVAAIQIMLSDKPKHLVRQDLFLYELNFGAYEVTVHMAVIRVDTTIHI